MDSPYQNPLVLAVTTLVCEMVLADGRVVEEEAEVALKMVNTYFEPPGLAMEDFLDLVSTFSTYSSEDRSEITGALLEGIAQHLDVENRKKFVYVAAQLAGSDGSFVAPEFMVVMNVAESLGFEDPAAVLAEVAVNPPG
jgi:uncharacterized tellurite resistance protein B-like protein